MAFLKYAKALVPHPLFGAREWGNFVSRIPGTRVASRKNGNLISQASEILGEDFDPSKYLLSHCTIVASVDTQKVEGVSLGRVKEASTGETITRKWDDYRITPETLGWINNNYDSWSRPVLMKSYRTFVGGHNFCFVPGTEVMMADGSMKAIEEVVVGDEVITHNGRPRKVLHTFERDINEDICAVHVGRYKDPILCTQNHPFHTIDVKAPPTSKRKGSKTSSALRHRKDQIIKALRGEKNVFGDKFSASCAWKDAGNLHSGDFLLGPKRIVGTTSAKAEAYLLGYYAAEGCPLGVKSDGFVLSFGKHESTLANHARDCAYQVFPEARVKISTSQPTLRVAVYAPGARDWCISMGGHLSHKKRLDEAVFSWDRESLLCLLAAWMSGDGDLHGETQRLRGVSTSKTLASQMNRIAELVGVKSCVVFIPQKIGEVQSQTRLVVGGELRTFDVIPRHHAWSMHVSRHSAIEIQTRSKRWSPLQEIPKKREDFAWWDNYRVHKVSKVDRVPYSGKVYNFEVEEDNSYVVSHGVAVHNCEHVQIEAQSKGRLIDAVARDIGPSVYVDILVATNRKHAQLIKDIQEGRMSTLSMGCVTTNTTCTKCGNVAADESDLCTHIRFEKGNTFYDERGMPCKVAELCGHESEDPTGGVNFIEASWVATPAFTGAVMRNIIEPEVIDLDRMQKVLNSPPPQWSSKDTMKSAGTFDFDDDGNGEDQQKETQDSLENLQDEIEQTILERAKKRLKEKLQEKVQQDAAKPEGELATSTNQGPTHDASVKTASMYRRGVGLIVRTARDDRTMLAQVDLHNSNFGIYIPTRIYKTSLQVGPTAKYGSVAEYLDECRIHAQGDLTAGEAKTLIRLGHLLSLRKSRSEH